jgi:hypothetical protein
LLQHNPKARKSSKNLFEKYQDKLYQEMVVGDVREYKKILGFLFSSRNMYDWGVLDINIYERDLKLCSDSAKNLSDIGGEFNLTVKEIHKHARVRDYLYKKLFLCFENHNAYEVKLNPLVNCSDKRYLTRFSSKTDPLALVAKIQKTQI